MKTTTTTQAQENTKTATRPQRATAKDINRLGTSIAYKVISSTYQQTGVHFYQELLWGAYRDKQLFEKMVNTEYTDEISDKIKANEDIKAMYQTAQKDIKAQIKDLEKVDIFSTTTELYASVLEEIEQNKVLQAEYEEIEYRLNKEISTDKADLSEAEKIKTTSTFSDFRDVANTAIYYILLAMRKSNIDYIPQGEKFRKLYRLICRYVRKYMSKMVNPDTSISTKTAIAKRPCTEEEVKNYITTTTTTQQDGTTEEKAEILTFKDDTTKCSYTIKWYNDSKQRKAGYYKRYKYITYSKYQYITDGNTNGDTKEFRIQSSIEMKYTDVEKVLYIAEKCKLSAREQCFIKCFLSACQVVTDKDKSKEYKKILDYTYKKMARLGYPIASRANFLQDLKRRIAKYYTSNNAVNQAIINDGISTGRSKTR